MTTVKTGRYRHYEGREHSLIGVVSDNPHEEDTDGHRPWNQSWRAARQHDYDESGG